MRMVQVALHQIIHMVSVRHPLMPAMRPVHVVRPMRRAGVARRTVVRILFANPQGVFHIVVAFMIVHVAIVQIVHMSFMLHRRVPATRAVHMDVIAIGVNRVRHMPSVRPF